MTKKSLSADEAFFDKFLWLTTAAGVHIPLFGASQQPLSSQQPIPDSKLAAVINKVETWLTMFLSMLTIVLYDARPSV